LVLACRWPASHWILLDAQARRGAFLQDAVATLGLADRVQVLVDRAERAAHDPDLRGTVDLVTARSFGPPAVTAECAVGFLRTGAHLVVSEPPKDDPARWPPTGVAALGLQDEGRHGGVRLLTCVEPVDASLPRREGVPAKHPRW
jgi:16S rRNA (guanine527-N7)-methyltransferase